MTTPPRFSLVKPTTQTPFHIDFTWWKDHDSNWRVYLLSCLCEEHQAAYQNLEGETWIDWIDPETAEVQTLDGLQHILVTHCARQPEFVTNFTTVVDGVFRVLLAAGNTPMAPAELAEKLDRPAETILRTLAGPQVYKGIRPVSTR
ncbi:MAG TPA: hypothetical protein PKH92_14050 [Anaerolineaceae bacterium]|jgi:hypothetical protein|nr:hypothetical protein [Anaerolineaceae bacterium]